MIVTTGGRAWRSPSASSTASGSASSSAACLITDLPADLGRDQLDLVVGERLRRSAHLPEPHEDLDDLGHRRPEGVREVLDGDARLDRDGTGRQCGCCGAASVLARPVRAAAAPRGLARCRLRSPPCACAPRGRRRGRIGRFGLFGPSAIRCQCRSAAARARPRPAAAGRGQSAPRAPPARSTRSAGRCRRLGPAGRDPERAGRRPQRSG